jgi:hypothetical protein
MAIQNHARLQIEGTEYTFGRHGKLGLLLDGSGHAYTRRGADGRKMLPTEDQIASLIADGEAQLLPPIEGSSDQDGDEPSVFRGIVSSRPIAGSRAPAASARPEHGGGASRRFSIEDADELMTDLAKLALCDPDYSWDRAYEMYRRELKAMNRLTGEGHAPVDPSAFDRRMIEVARHLERAGRGRSTDRSGSSSAIH